ncbi:MAG TPA: hypothetical protein VK604_11650 [Bryobacteraceae bacterium]|nr:hypothetical protein [Bryobacteraceae bacterium]
MKLLSPVLSFFLIPLLVVLPLQAQLPAPAAADSTSAFQLRLVESTKGAASAFTVEVTDSQGRPVPDAAVAFRLPDAGPSGTFPGGEHAAVVYTDATGRARSPGIQWGATAGSVTLRITAAKAGLHAGLLVEETVGPAHAVAGVSNSKAADASVPNGQTLLVVPGNNAVAAATPETDPAKYPRAPGTLTGIPAKPSLSAKSGAAPAPVHVPEPVVSVVNTPKPSSHGNKKWLIMAIIAVGAGVGVAMAMKGKGAAPAAAPAVTPPIGAPGVTIGASH